MISQINLSDFFVTKAQADEFVQSLDDIMDQLFEINFNLEKSLTKEFGLEKKDKFINVLRDIGLTDSSTENLKQLLEQMQVLVKKIPVLSMTIAFEPDDNTLKAFLQWFLFSLNKQVLIDIHVDKSLIAGATLNYNGKFKDYSIKPLFNDIIHKKLYPVPQTSSNPNSNPILNSNPNENQSTEHMHIGR